VCLALVGLGWSACGKPAALAPDGGAPPATGSAGAAGGGAGAGGSVDASTGSDGAPEAAAASGGGGSVGSVRPDGGTGPYHATAVATGLHHSCALLDDGNVKCWGYNRLGQLGLGDGFRRGADPKEMGDALPVIDLGTGRWATAIAAGGEATCAILDDGSVKCWGDGHLVGLSGDGTKDWGDDPDEMGDHLPALDLGAGRRATHVAVGTDTGCAVLDDGSARCWGKGPASITPMAVSLGAATPVRALAPTGGGMLVLFIDGTVTRLYAKTTSLLLAAADRATAITSDGIRDCAIVDGRAGCASAVGGGPIGANDTFFHYGAGSDDGTVAQYTGPSPLPRLFALGLDADQGACAILEDGRVGCQKYFTSFPCTPDWCALSTSPTDGTFYIQLGHPAAALTTGGEQHLCALTTNGEVRCWGGPYMPTTPFDALGSSFDFSESNGTFSYGPFHSIDLGSHH
jgi:alpha-tubulin suppressor-like RCC1 family protein